MYILTRVNLLYTLCYEIPCNGTGRQKGIPKGVDETHHYIVYDLWYYIWETTVSVSTLWWRHHPSHSTPAIHLWLDHWKWITWPAIQLIKHWLWQQKLSFIAFSYWHNIVKIIMRSHFIILVHLCFHGIFHKFHSLDSFSKYCFNLRMHK